MNSKTIKNEQLKKIISTQFYAGHIAEPLLSYDYDTDALYIKKIMDDKGYDIIGIRKDNRVTHKIIKVDLVDSPSKLKLRKIVADEIVSQYEPLESILAKFIKQDVLFVETINERNGIITKADLEKLPVRMWLFSFITLLEIEILDVLRIFYDDVSCKNFLSENRVKKAKKIYSGRAKRNTEIDLLDCLQFCDKRDLLLNNNIIMSKLEMNKKTLYEQLYNIADLRDHLAHSQSIVKSFGTDLIHYVRDIKNLLDKLEKF